MIWPLIARKPAARSAASNLWNKASAAFAFFSDATIVAAPKQRNTDGEKSRSAKAASQMAGRRNQQGSPKRTETRAGRSNTPKLSPGSCARHPSGSWAARITGWRRARGWCETANPCDRRRCRPRRHAGGARDRRGRRPDRAPLFRIVRRHHPQQEHARGVPAGSPRARRSLCDHLIDQNC